VLDGTVREFMLAAKEMRRLGERAASPVLVDERPDRVDGDLLLAQSVGSVEGRTVDAERVIN
jgi:hypothetical protein